MASAADLHVAVPPDRNGQVGFTCGDVGRVARAGVRLLVACGRVMAMDEKRQTESNLFTKENVVDPTKIFRNLEP